MKWIDILDKKPESGKYICGSNKNRLVFGISTDDIFEDKNGAKFLKMVIPHCYSLELLITHWLEVPDLPKAPQNEGPKE